MKNSMEIFQLHYIFSNFLILYFNQEIKFKFI